MGAEDPEVVPFGAWPSPITADSLVAGATGVGEVVPDGADVWWAESRPDEGGRTALMRWRDGAVAEMTPGGANVRTRVHEYGGGSWWVDGGDAFYVDYADQRLRLLSGDGEPVLLTEEPAVRAGLRYADGRLSADRAWYVCVREQHGDPGESGAHAEPENQIVAVATDGSMRVEVLAAGADFYACPRPSPDGTQVAWVQWSHPNMPWDDTELWLADLADGAVANARRVIGGGAESVWQPEWHPRSGTLHYLSDRSDLWWLYELGVDDPVVAGPEITTPGWVFGTSRYAWRLDGDTATPITIGVTDGVEHCEVAPAQTFFGNLRGNEHGLVWSAASWAEESSVWRGATRIKAARDIGLDAAFLPAGEGITFPTSGGDEAHAIFYAPANPGCVGPPGARPPLLVLAHGGPTSAARSTLDLTKRYWTSRGVAVVDVNYRGSVGYGRAYRQKLNGQWGVADVDDCLAAARFLVERGDVDPDQLLIKGGSAGGFTVLAALVASDRFAAGASRYGVADLAVLATDTHKFEARYLDSLIGPWPEARDLYEQRSPINHVERLTSPMIVLQGDEDEVVPPNQSHMVVEALRANGVRVEYLEFAGEQHGFRKAENIVAALEAELTFFGEVLGFAPVL